MLSLTQHRWLALVSMVSCTLLARAVAAEPPSDSERHFVSKVRPLLVEKCLACHGKDETKGGFDVRTRKAVLKGGDSGEAAIVPGKPDESRLLSAIERRDPETAMPPKENDRLSAGQIADIRKWIEAGAPWPSEERIAELRKTDAGDSAEGVTVRTSGGLSPEWTNRKYKPENLWAYRPVVKPSVPAVSGGTPIDAFLNAKLDRSPAPPADRATLIRRVTYDLTGLPPAWDEIQDFLDDPSNEDVAFARVVDRLLASPRYGEHWGRKWLDVVRYADSSGFSNDYDRGNAWRYRDYVVRSFNTDQPYDQFLKEQIAGDEIDPENPELLVAVGFLRMGPWELTGMEVPKVARQRFLDDVTNAVGEVFLGHALQCARCHDHKFDPIPTQDYYRLQAVFATTQLAERTAAFLPAENTGGFDQQRFLEARRREYREVLEQLDQKSLDAARAWYREAKLSPDDFEREVEKAARGAGGRNGLFQAARNALLRQNIPEDRIPPRHAGFTPQDYGQERVARKGLERLQWELDRYQPIALSVYSGRTPQVSSVSAPQRMPVDRMTRGELQAVAILAGGDAFSPTTNVTPGALSVVDSVFAPLEISGEITGRRKALAEWLADPRHPLTARVMVNRVWQGHFGSGLAGNPNNFGATGKKPTHPELLDWLTATFIEDGWSIKALHRRILMSEAWRRGTELVPFKGGSNGTSSVPRDYAVFRPRRLTAEELRDSLLFASGELNPAIGGIPVRPEMNADAALQPRQVMGTFAPAWQPSAKPEQRHRRSLYALKLRGLRDPFADVFNEPNPDLSCEFRDTSTVTPQVFALFNSTDTYRRAIAMAMRCFREDRRHALEHAFRLAYGRLPSTEELAACESHWRKMTDRHKTLTFPNEKPVTSIVREAVEENTGETFTFTETLHESAEFVPDLGPADVEAVIRGLAEVCLVLLNSNEFVYVY